MKICPKCGQELVGDRCPKCDGPEIVVNNNEYLRRKKAYEEKQAKQKSASSHSESAENTEPLGDVLAQLKKNSTTAVKKVQKVRTKAKHNLNGKQIKNKDSSDEGQNVETQAEESSGISRSTRKRKRNKNVTLVIVLVAVMLVITAATFGVYKLVTRKNQILYMSYNNKVYNVSSLDSSYVCDMQDAIFAADKKTFYIAEWPEEIEKNKLSETCVSQNGKYFSAVIYDEPSGVYSLYAWNEEGCFKVSENKLKKNVKTITDGGVVIYTDVEMVNEEGYSGDYSLYVCKLSTDKSQEKGSRLLGNNVKVESRLRSAYVYSDSNLVICYNDSDRLYTYNYKKDEKKTIADHVEAIYPMSEESAYLYTSQIKDENTLSEADSLVYQVDGTFMYYNLDHDTKITIGKQTGVNLSFVYEKKNSCIYVISSSAISYAEVKDNKVGEFKKIDQLGVQQNFMYMSDESTLLYVNASNQLMSMNKGTTKQICEQVKDGSVTRVGNTDNGITYVVDQTQYYRSDLSASEVAMYTESGLSDTTDTYLYKNRLYFYNAAKELYSCTLKGKDNHKIGQVDSLWLGY
ncbi:MAG: zf-TFIIB domain-containing protein [Lachnospira sp.]|nr:zf-TFIIB domain-containing protein [Lachnospira sp.]